MTRFSSPLDNVHVAAPCSADWDQMMGNDRSRFCGQCNLNVYNLSSMTQAEAEHFVAGSEGRLCVRFYRRRDGSILTQNCPIGLRAIRRRVSAITRAITSVVLTFFAGLGVYEWLSATAIMDERFRGTTGVMVAQPHAFPISPRPVVPIVREPRFAIMGDIGPPDSEMISPSPKSGRNPHAGDK